MKRLILTTFFIVLALAGFCQKHIRLSFTGSPSINWMNTDNPDANNGKAILGYTFGMNGDFYFSADERYSFLTGILVTNNGGIISYKSTSPFQFAGVTLPALTKITYHLRYIEIPLAIKLKTDQFNRVRYWGLYGLSTMVNIDSKGDSNDGTLKKAAINHEINPVNLAMDLGIGFDYDLGTSNSVTAGLIFQNGLTDVTTDNAFRDRTKINSLKFKVGIIF